MATNRHVGILALGLAAAASAITLAEASPARAEHAIYSDFSDPSALEQLTNQARETFAVWTTFGSAPGGVSACPTAGDYANCWVWWQPEGGGGTIFAGLRVEPTVDEILL